VVTVTVGPKAGALPAGSGGLRDVEFAEFFRAEHKKLIRFVIAIGASGDEAAEIAQVTFFFLRKMNMAAMTIPAGMPSHAAMW
jgi:hypothetical protein